MIVYDSKCIIEIKISIIFVLFKSSSLKQNVDEFFTIEDFVQKFKI